MKTIKFIYKLLRKNSLFGEIKSSTLYDLINEIQSNLLEQYSKATNAKQILERANQSEFTTSANVKEIGTFSIDNSSFPKENLDQLAKELESTIIVKSERIGEYNDKKLDLETLRAIE